MTAADPSNDLPPALMTPAPWGRNRSYTVKERSRAAEPERGPSSAPLHALAAVRASERVTQHLIELDRS